MKSINEALSAVLKYTLEGLVGDQNINGSYQLPEVVVRVAWSIWSYCFVFVPIMKQEHYLCHLGIYNGFFWNCWIGIGAQWIAAKVTKIQVQDVLKVQGWKLSNLMLSVKVCTKCGTGAAQNSDPIFIFFVHSRKSCALLNGNQ